MRAASSPRTADQAQNDPAADSGNALKWGTAETGLRLGLSVTSSRPSPALATILIALENASDTDVFVNLGHMFGNGAIMFPDAVHLMLIDGGGATHHLQYADARQRAISGRLDDFVIPLKSRARYSFDAPLDAYWSTTVSTTKLRPGSYQLVARFEGGGTTTANADMLGVALQKFWKGTVLSARAEFRVPVRPQYREAIGPWVLYVPVVTDRRTPQS
jgi:hypothetical protein